MKLKTLFKNLLTNFHFAVTTFSFGAKPASTSNDNDLSASTKIASTPALSGFKFGASLTQTKPATVAATVVSSNKQSTDEMPKETQSSELVFGSQNKNDVISVPLPVVPPKISLVSFGSLKSDPKLPVFGATVSQVDSASSLTQTKPVFGSTTTTTTTVSTSNTLTSTAQSTSLANTVTPSSTPAPVFAFGQTQNASKGGFSFTQTPVVNDKKAFPTTDFAQSQIKPAATTLSFGSSSATVTTSAPAAPFGSSFIFGQSTTTAPSESTISSAFGSKSVAPASGFSFGSTSTPSQPISTTSFGAQQSEKPPQPTPVFPSAANAITTSLPTEPATSPFMFRSTANIEPAPTFGQSSTSTFGQSSSTQIPPFSGVFGSQSSTPAAPFSANANPLGGTITNNAAPTTFGSASPFGSTVNATQTPTFGNAANNSLSNSFGVPNSFGSQSTGFGSMIHTAPTNADEPSAKKASPGFGTLSNSNIQVNYIGAINRSSINYFSFVFKTETASIFVWRFIER